jgi:DNA-binding transcriptional MocR family regulator
MKRTSRTAVDIAESMEASIHGGRYEPGALLPPVRQLASSLKVSTATVAAAYRLLRMRGLLVGDRRRGTRVRPHAHVHRLATRSRTSASDTLTDLASGNPDPALLPSIAAALRSISDEPLLYGASAELRGLVAFARSEFGADGIAVDDVLVCGGALDTIERVLREHLRPGDRVVIEDPCHPTLYDLLIACGYVVDAVAVDQDGPQVESLAAALARNPKAMILTPRAQNPTGAAISADRAAGLRAVLKRHQDVVLIENDPCGPIAGAPCITLTPARKHWAIARSTSKFLGPDLRVAVLAGDATTVARVRGRQALGARWVSHVLQQLALSLWSDPAAGRHLARVAETYAHRRGSLIRALVAEGVVTTAVSGFNVWIPVHHEAAVVERLAASGWAVAAGERFRIHSGPGIRVTASALQPEASQRFARDLGVALRAAPPTVA